MGICLWWVFGGITALHNGSASSVQAFCPLHPCHVYDWTQALLLWFSIDKDCWSNISIQKPLQHKLYENTVTHKLTLCNCGFWFTVPLEAVTSFLCACNITVSMMICSGGVFFVVSQLCFQCSYKSTRTPTTWVLLHRPLTFWCHDDTFLLPCKPPHIFSLQISSMFCTVLYCFAPTWGPVEKSFFLFGHMHWVGWT
jgi:hypothetical protein